jgi:outer membrane receptor protein involved in Fe transport
VHLSIDASDNTLGNPGATPVQALDVSRSSIFTAPNEVYNKYVSLNLNGTTRLDDNTTLQGVAYYQNLTQRITNGATSDVMPCDNGTGELCNDDGTPVTGRGGVVTPDFLHGGVYSALSLEGLNSQAYGASAQVTNEVEIAGHENRLVAGVAFDGSDSVFDAQSQNGGFDLNTYSFIGPGVTQDQPSEAVAPTRLATVTRDYAFYGVDVFKITPKLDLNLSGRFTNAEIDLHDKLGTVLDGQHTYNRFNPSAGLTYTFVPELQVYGNYTEANRAPTPTELSCSSAAYPCSLLSFFIGDPNLKQVVSRTFEAGLRGHVDDLLGGRFRWDVDYFHTKNYDDITYQADLTNVNLSYYTNVGTTLRQGVEADLHYDTGRLHATLGYAYTEATFLTPLLLNSPDNPAANANGQIQVEKGDYIPGIPRHRGNLVVDYELTDRLTVGTSMVAQSSTFRFGDEANIAKPVGGYYVLNLNASYRLTDSLTVFALVDNVLDKRYDTYGGFGPVSALPFAFVPGGVTDTRTASPAAPLAAYAGARFRF